MAQRVKISKFRVFFWSMKENIWRLLAFNNVNLPISLRDKWQLGRLNNKLKLEQKFYDALIRREHQSLKSEGKKISEIRNEIEPLWAERQAFCSPFEDDIERHITRSLEREMDRLLIECPPEIPTPQDDITDEHIEGKFWKKQPYSSIYSSVLTTAGIKVVREAIDHEKSRIHKARQDKYDFWLRWLVIIIAGLTGLFAVF